MAEQAAQIEASELDEIWSRLHKLPSPISEHDFLTVARWAYHAMPAHRVRGAIFDLFEQGHAAPRRVSH